MKTSESAEMYLETILILTRKRGYVRSIDIVNEMGYSKPSISVAMKNLREAGFIEVDESGIIKLTESGSDVAETVYERHTLISSLLMRLGVDKDTALEDACRIEHVISQESFEAIKRHLKD